MIQDLSPKQIQAITESNAFVNVYEGSVRAGKSFASIIAFMEHLRTGPKGDYIVCGKSERTIRMNVLEPIQRFTGGIVRYNQVNGYFWLFDKKVYVVGANDERAEGKIRGSTFCGALVDEATLLPEGFFRMLLTRLTPTGAKLIATTNPDSPFHWLKHDYIDKYKNDPKYLKVHSFKIDDNPSLSPDKIEQIKKSYSGLWYKRFIEGDWVLAEGAIFDFFDHSYHTAKLPPSYAKYYIVGIDYGTTNAFAAVLVGFNDDVHPSIWVEKEYYWDSKKMGMQKTDAEYAFDVEREFAGYPVRMYYVDPAAASFEVEMRRGRKPVVQANNDVLNGIRFVSDLFTRGDLTICQSCVNLIREVEGYVWDSKSIKLGKDQPLKQRDHACVVGDTLIKTTKGDVEIRNLVDNHNACYVLGYNNFFDFHLCVNAKMTKKSQKIYKLTLQNGKSIRATDDHKVYCKRGYVEIRNLLPDDEILCYN